MQPRKKTTLKRILSVFLALIILSQIVSFSLAKETDYQVGDLIQFGSYPQSRVEETPEIKSAASQATWKFYEYYCEGSLKNYMQFADFFYNQTKIRAVTFDSHRRDSVYAINPDFTNQDDNGYFPNKTYYFKYEPLSWRILDPNTGYILCENIIDSQAYQNIEAKSSIDNEYYFDVSKQIYANNYAASSIREWLNKDFLNTAFSKNEAENIKTVHLNNAVIQSGYEKYNSPHTEDKLFLPSYSDVTNSLYGFAPSDEADENRQAIGTDYAKCQDLYVYNNTSNWWLRNPGHYSDFVCIVDMLGDASSAMCGVSNTNLGIRPACCLNNLASSITISCFLPSAERIVHTYRTTTIEPTCTEDGFSVYTCSICGETLKENYISAMGHSQPNENGKCSRCGKQLIEAKEEENNGNIFKKLFSFLIHFLKLLNLWITK